MSTITLNKSNIFKGNLILVNADFPLKCSANIELMPANVNFLDIFVEKNVSNFLIHALAYVNCTHEIVPVSGYRTLAEQENIYATSLAESGDAFTRKYVALPSHSEHQTGLAIDLGLNKDEIDFIRPDFPYSGICDAFRKSAHRYGFIERYQKGKEHMTGIAQEPWHFRFVGYPHSEIISTMGLCLEEYIEYLKNFTYEGEHLKFLGANGEVEIFYLPILSDCAVTLPLPENYLWQVSGNNCDGVIITLWRRSK
ncbi:MAG: M15 family metallopeptidase [Oscillospiraceae bacterium]